MNYKGQLLLLVFILMFSVAILLWVSKKASNRREGLKVAGRLKSNYSIKAYPFFSQFFLTRRMIKKIRSRIEMLELSDHWTINKKTMEIAFLSMGVILGLFIGLLLLSQKISFLLIGIATLYIIYQQIVRLFVEKMDDRLLYQFEKFLGDVRHHYHEHGMIDEAIYDCIDENPPEITAHAERMLEALTGEDVEAELLRYYEIVPNKYFKTFIALGYTIQKFGDQIIDGKSMFLTNLNYLKQEINLETLRRSKLNHLFKSLSIIAVTPMFFLSAIEKWAKGNLPELKGYYEGAYGFIVQVVLFLVILLSYQLIHKLQSNYEWTEDRYKLENRILKGKIIRKWVKGFIENSYSTSLKRERLLKITGTHTSAECFFMRRILFGICGFILCCLVLIQAHGITKKQLLSESNEITMESQFADREGIAEIDREYILNYRGKKISYQELEALLKGDSRVNDRVKSITTSRIWDKRIEYENQYFKWWECLMAVMVGIIFFQIPLWMLMFKRNVIAMSMEDEVMQFHTIILMLMHIERISVEDLLEWMGSFASIFKESIQKSLNNFEQGDLQALQELKEDEPFIPFVRIVENLQAATDRISISRAFDELNIERSYYQDKRKQDNEILISQKGAWGKVIAFTPFTLTLLLYLITPFIHLSISQFMNYSNQIQSFL